MKRLTTTVFGAMMLLSPLVMHASAEIHVTKDGKASISNAKVIQISGNTFFTRLYWGDAFIRFTVKSNSSTKFLRATGETTTIAEIKPDDLLDVVGELETTDTLTIAATSIKNSSVQKAQSVMSGTVEAIYPDAPQFTIITKELGRVIVNITTSTQFFKGSRTIDLAHLRIGDRITKVSGDYDLPTKTLVAQSVRVYIDPNIFTPQNFVGTLTETPAATTTIKVTLNKIPYTVFVTDKTLIMRADKSATTLKRFVAGDPIRLYGVIREIDEPQIDAEVIRNLSL